MTRHDKGKRKLSAPETRRCVVSRIFLVSFSSSLPLSPLSLSLSHSVTHPRPSLVPNLELLLLSFWQILSTFELILGSGRKILRDVHFGDFVAAN